MTDTTDRPTETDITDTCDIRVLRKGFRDWRDIALNNQRVCQSICGKLLTAQCTENRLRAALAAALEALPPCPVYTDTDDETSGTARAYCILHDALEMGKP